MSKLVGVARVFCMVVLLCGVYGVPARALTPEEVVAKSRDSVVRVLIEVRPGDNDLLQHYNFKSSRQFKEAIRVQAGTGFVIREDGYILTAYHVVYPLGLSPRIYVRLPKEGDQLADVVASDKERQVACLKIRKFNLKPLALAAEMPNVGSEVFTMGFPLAAVTSEMSDQEPVFAEGKVGALKRSRQESTFIQTNAPINLGNSGGPLLGKEGQVVGVVIGSPNGSLKKMFEGMFEDKEISVGIGFTTPTKPVLDMLTAAAIDLGALKPTAASESIRAPATPPAGASKADSKNPATVPLILAACLALLLVVAAVALKSKKGAPEQKTAAAPVPPQPDFAKSTTISLGTLVCTEGELAGRTFAMTERGLTIGRDSECDIKLSAEVISRRHSWVGPKGGDIAVRDMGSTNGTFVNGIKVEGLQTLKDGDTVSLSKSGQQVFQFAE